MKNICQLGVCTFDQYIHNYHYDIYNRFGKIDDH